MFHKIQDQQQELLVLNLYYLKYRNLHPILNLDYLRILLLHLFFILIMMIFLLWKYLYNLLQGLLKQVNYQELNQLCINLWVNLILLLLLYQYILLNLSFIMRTILVRLKISIQEYQIIQWQLLILKPYLHQEINMKHQFYIQIRWHLQYPNLNVNRNPF